MIPAAKLKSILKVNFEDLSSLTGIDADRLRLICNGRDAPSTKELRDLATLAGVTVDEFELLGDEDCTDSAKAIREHLNDFWGCIRVALPGAALQLSWPISAYEAGRLKEHLPNERKGSFFSFDTLDARSVQLCVGNLMSIVLAEFRHDAQHPAQPVWAPPEVYRAAKEAIEDPQAFEIRNSSALQSRSLALTKAYGWHADRAALHEHAHGTRIHLIDGRCVRIHAEPLSLYDLNRDLGFSEPTAHVTSNDDMTELLLCLEHLAVVDMPLNDLMDGWPADYRKVDR